MAVLIPKSNVSINVRLQNHFDMCARDEAAIIQQTKQIMEFMRTLFKHNIDFFHKHAIDYVKVIKHPAQKELEALFEKVNAEVSSKLAALVFTGVNAECFCFDTPKFAPIRGPFLKCNYLMHAIYHIYKFEQQTPNKDDASCAIAFINAAEIDNISEYPGIQGLLSDMGLQAVAANDAIVKKTVDNVITRIDALAQQKMNESFKGKILVSLERKLTVDDITKSCKISCDYDNYSLLVLFRKNVERHPIILSLNDETGESIVEYHHLTGDVKINREPLSKEIEYVMHYTTEDTTSYMVDVEPVHPIMIQIYRCDIDPKTRLPVNDFTIIPLTYRCATIHNGTRYLCGNIGVDKKPATMLSRLSFSLKFENPAHKTDIKHFVFAKCHCEDLLRKEVYKMGDMLPSHFGALL
jgi:hypothetical protein